MLGNLTGWHALILLAVVLLVFGATKLPALAKSAGQSIKIFKGEMKSDAPAADDDTARTASVTDLPARTDADVAPRPVVSAVDPSAVRR